MGSTKSILFFALFTFQAITSALTSNSTSGYDITKLQNEAIVKIFRSSNPISTMKLIAHLGSNVNSKFEFQNTQRLGPFGNKFYFHYINISIWRPESTPIIDCDFYKNRTRIFNKELVFKVVGLFGAESKKTFARFETIIKLRDVWITATESSSGFYNNQFQINFSYNHLVYNFLTIPWAHEKLPPNKQDKLIKKIKTIIPLMIHDNIKYNEKFVNALHSSFCHRPHQSIISIYPNYPSNEQQYYYHIPKISFSGINLANIKITGLSNFESLKHNATFGNSAYTLILKNVRGNMILDNKEFQNLKFYEMIFNVAYLAITVDHKSKQMVVEARGYNVIQNTYSRPPTISIFSSEIMRSIESAISYLISPALEVPDSAEDLAPILYNMESLEGKMITEASLNTTESITNSTETTDIITQPSSDPDDKLTVPEYCFKSKSFPRFTIRLRKTRRWFVPTLMRPWMKTPKWFKWSRKSFNPFPYRKTSTTSQTTTTTTTTTVTTMISKTNNEQNESSSTLQTTTTSSSTSTLSHTASKTSLSSSTQNRESSIGQTITNIPLSTDTKISIKEIEDIEDEQEPYDYDISFHNVTIKLISGTPYPRHIQCEFFKNLKIDHQISAVPNGNIHLNNKGNSININFHANFTSIKISVVNPANNSTGNQSCEFQINSNRDVQVVLPSLKNTNKLSENLKIKNKIDKTLMSSITTERLSQSVKPLACLPFNFCSQSVRILDDFFLGFVDKILTKCYLRRDNTITSTTSRIPAD